MQRNGKPLKTLDKGDAPRRVWFDPDSRAPAGAIRPSWLAKAIDAESPGDTVDQWVALALGVPSADIDRDDGAVCVSTDDGRRVLLDSKAIAAVCAEIDRWLA